MSGVATASIARSAMALKEAGKEPTYRRVVSRCPKAVVNPATGKPVSKKRVYDVFREHCYDEEPEVPWKHRPRLARSALTAESRERRLAWAHHVKGLGHTPSWYARHVIWTDLCNSILPRSEKRATEMALASKGRSGWVSEDAKAKSYNLRGRKEVLKQNSWDAVRVWWAPILARGKLHVHVFGEDFSGETPAGAAALAEAIPTMLTARFPNAQKPRVVFVDRGKGFFSPATGKITDSFAAALRQSGLRAFVGDDASMQPGHLADAYPHETAVSWLRHELEDAIPKKAWKETVGAYAARLRAACRRANARHDVDGLCRHAFLQRIDELIVREGDKLGH